MISYKNESFELDDGVDIGYGVEKINLKFPDNSDYVAPIRGVTTLLVSAPIIDDSFLSQLRELDSEFASKSVEGFEAVFVLGKGQEVIKGMEFLKFGTDEDDEYSCEFGTKINRGEICCKLTKSLFVISRDFVLFYKEICKNIEDEFNLDKLYFNLGKALNVYTGTGCH